jgi:hypothetical protein
MTMNVEPLGPVHITLRAGVDLFGFDELQIVCFAAAGIMGGWLGMQLAGVLWRLLG